MLSSLDSSSLFATWVNTVAFWNLKWVEDLSKRTIIAFQQRSLNLKVIIFTDFDFHIHCWRKMSSGPTVNCLKDYTTIFSLLTVCVQDLFQLLKRQTGTLVNVAGTNHSCVFYPLIPPAPWSKQHSRTAWINREALQLPRCTFSHWHGLSWFLSASHHSIGCNVG